MTQCHDKHHTINTSNNKYQQLWHSRVETSNLLKTHLVFQHKHFTGLLSFLGDRVSLTTFFFFFCICLFAVVLHYGLYLIVGYKSYDCHANKLVQLERCWCQCLAGRRTTTPTSYSWKQVTRRATRQLRAQRHAAVTTATAPCRTTLSVNALCRRQRLPSGIYGSVY